MENIFILNTDFEIISIIDVFESFLWIERYNKYGEFEIYTKPTEELLSVLVHDNYVYVKESEYLMIIESVELKTNSENGSSIIIKGRSFESAFYRRIIWVQTTLSGDLQNGIKSLIDDNAISPIDADREIPNLQFELSTDPNITDLDVSAQFTRDILYETIEKICVSNDIGFKITYDPDTYTCTFKLYKGVDRSYAQLTNPYVVFSPEYENIIKSEVVTDKSNFKNITVVGGEGEGVDRIIEIVEGTNIQTKMGRREMHTDARDLSQTVDEILIPEVDYRAQLAQRGLEDLSENKVDSSFDSEIDATKSFKYGEDFFLGDIVQIVNEYGISSRARVTEVVISTSVNGSETIPTFTIIE